MRLILALLTALTLSACASTPTVHVKRDLCDRTPYCAKVTTAGKTDADLELELRDVRAAVETSRDE